MSKYLTKITPTLTKGMITALIQIGYGVKAVAGGYVCVEERNEKLDLRSAEALYKRNLIFYRYRAKGVLNLTERGEKIFEDLIKNKTNIIT